MNATPRFIPALSFRFLTPVYDAAMRLFFDEEGLRRPLIEQVAPKAGDRILDVGCGTATLTLQLWRAAPGVRVVGLDGDPQILALARTKMAKAGAAVELVEGLATRLPFPDAAFDHAVTSLLLHHLTTEDKSAALREMLRVLRPGGGLHVLDFGAPTTPTQRAVAAVIGHFEEALDNFAGRLPAMAQEAGFVDVSVLRTSGTVVGPVALLRATAPD